MAKKRKKTNIKEKQARIVLNLLNEELAVNDNSVKILSKLNVNALTEIERTTFNNRLQSYKRCVTMQMEFKDGLIKKLTDELEQFRECRNRARWNTLELVDNTLIAFKKEIEAIHNQYQIVVKLALPENLEELKSKVNENNANWKILKYYRGAVKMQTKKDRSKLEKTHIAKMNTEKGMYESIIDKDFWSDTIHFKNLQNQFSIVFEDYESKTKKLKEDFYKLKTKDENLEALQLKLHTNIKEFLKTISHLKEEIKEPESLKELNALIKKKNKLQEDFKNVMKKIKDSSKSSEEQKIYICQIVKLIENEINNCLTKGNKIIRVIHQCEKLETHVDKENIKSFPICTEPDNIQWPEQFAKLSELTRFWHRISYAEANSKSLDEEIIRLQSENEEIKEEIHNLVKRKSKMSIVNS